MRRPRYDSSGPKQTVSLTLNSDLYPKAKSLGINASRVAEQATQSSPAAAGGVAGQTGGRSSSPRSGASSPV